MSKETERAALHRTIWQVANDLRGSVDGWDFKAYVLGFLFYRFISENLTEYINAGEREAGDPDFDYRFLSHADAEGAREGIIQEKGFFIAPGDLFDNVRERAPRDENLNETLSRIFKSIEASATGTGSESDLRACSTTWTSTPRSSGTRSLSATRSSSRSWTPSGTWTCPTGSPRSTPSATPTSTS